MSLVYMWGTIGFLWLLSIIFHEWGHISELKRYYNYVPVVWTGKDLEVGQQWHYAALSPLKRGAVYLWGVYYGLFPLVFIALINRYVFFALFATYLYGCRHDLKQIWRLRKGHFLTEEATR